MTTVQRGTKMTLAEYRQVIETLEGLWELGNGELYEMPPPNLDHQQLIGFLYRMVCAHLDGTVPRLGWAWLGVGVALSDRLSPIPDLVFVRAERASLLRLNFVEGVPDLLAEVLSTDRRRDLVMKRQWYAEAGVPEYWIIDPVNDIITVLELVGSEYAERAVLGRDDTLTTPTIPGFALSLERLFANPEREQVRSR